MTGSDEQGVPAGSGTLGSVIVGVRLVLEPSALVVLGYWGYTLGESPATRFGLGIGVPLVVAVVWGVFGSPAAPYRLGQPWRAGLEALVLGGATIGLYLLEGPVPGAVFGVVAVLDTVLLYRTGRS